MLDLIIRPETQEDAGAVRQLLEAAFKTPGEAGLVAALRAGGQVSLALVAERAGRVVGHILFSPMGIENAPAGLGVLGLGPVAVHPDVQNQGIGSALVRAGLNILRQGDAALVFVLGNPRYYSRFGFQKTATFNLHCEFKVPAELFMVLELRDGTLSTCSGTVNYAPEFRAVS